MTAKISVIIPVYNVEKYLGRCLDSVINQTYQNLEIIVVNDCSPDNSEKIILEYQQKDNRIKYIKNATNQGLFQTRMIGFKASQGDFIANIDSDDTFSSLTLFEDFIGEFSDINIDIIAFSWNIVYEKREDQIHNRANTLADKKLQTINEKLDNFYTMNSITESMCKKIFRRSVLEKSYEKMPIKKIVFQEDGLMILNIFLNSKTIQLSPIVGYNYLQHEESSTHFTRFPLEKTINTLQDWIYVSNTTERWLKEHGLWEIYYKQFYERSFSFYNWMYEPLKYTLGAEYSKYEYLFVEAFLPWIFNNNTPCNFWCRFGKLSFKQKIKKTIVVILKKIGLYSILKKY